MVALTIADTRTYNRTRPFGISNVPDFCPTEIDLLQILVKYFPTPIMSQMEGRPTEVLVFSKEIPKVVKKGMNMLGLVKFAILGNLLSADSSRR